MQPPVELNVTSPPAGSGPVTVGVPWPRGVLRDAATLSLRDRQGRAIPLQTRALDRWPGGSARWVLLDWRAEAGAGPYRVAVGEAVATSGPELRVETDAGTITVDTGAARFVL